MLNCPKCGTPQESLNQKFCANCGAQLGSSLKNPGETLSPNPQAGENPSFSSPGPTFSQHIMPPANGYVLQPQQTNSAPTPPPYNGTAFSQTPNVMSDMNNPFSPPPANAAFPPPPIQEASVEDIFLLPEGEMFRRIINVEMAKIGLDEKADLKPVVHQKTVATLIFSLLLFGLGCIYFLRFFNILIPLLILLSVYHQFMKSFNTNRYILKQLRARPDENIAYVISSCTQTGPGKPVQILSRLAIILLPLLLLAAIFFEPHSFYEEVDGGYGLRYYTSGIIQEKEIVIPSTYKGMPVVSLRGELFKNLKSVQKITIPETVSEIRGEAFYNCTSLRQVNIPFSITEIKGDTFNGCKSLQAIELPPGLTRIGAHAFDNCDSLLTVYCPDSLLEIGSSAFRNCDKLGAVSVPSHCVIADRAFKDSSGYAAFR